METEKNNLATFNVEDWRKPGGGTRTQNGKHNSIPI